MGTIFVMGKKLKTKCINPEKKTFYNFGNIPVNKNYKNKINFFLNSNKDIFTTEAW